MKRKLIRRFSLMLAVIMMLVMALADTGIVLASTDGTYSLVLPKTMWIGQEKTAVVIQDAKGNAASIKSLTMSSADVLKLYKYKYKDEKNNEFYNYDIEPVNPGKVTLTVTFAKADGTQGSLSETVCVKTYPKVIKKLKVNGKKVKLAANVKTKTSGTVDQRYKYFVRNKKTTGRIKLSLKKGWRVSKVTSTLSDIAGDNFKDYSEKITKKTILKGKKFKFPKSWDELYVTVTLKNKDGEALEYTVVMYRRAHY